MSIFSQLRPDEVFTPRSAKVNDRVYVHRPDLEAQVVRAIKGSKHFCIFGESGNGKSWLYKKVFEQNKVPHRVVNLTTATLHGSLLRAIDEKATSLKSDFETTTTTTVTIGVNPGGVGATRETETTYEKKALEPVERLFKLLGGAPSRPAILVLDNFEMICNSAEIVSEISSLVMLLDDEDYAKYCVKLCIVGVPSEIREYIAQQENRATIMNRISEVSEVSRLTHDEAMEVLKRGFEDHLKLIFKTLADKVHTYERILSVSDRIASEVQDLGLRVSQLAVENQKIVEPLIVEDAISDWITSSHNGALTTVIARMNKSSSKTGRRNQCLFCLGKIEMEDFRISDVEEIFESSFPASMKAAKISVARLLTELSQGANAPIKRLAVGDGYRFTHPKYKMAIRSALVVREGERVDVRRQKV